MRRGETKTKPKQLEQSDMFKMASVKREFMPREKNKTYRNTQTSKKPLSFTSRLLAIRERFSTDPLPVYTGINMRDAERPVRGRWCRRQTEQEVQVSVCFECEVLRMDPLGVHGGTSRGFLPVVKRQVSAAFPDEMLHRSQVHVGIQNLPKAMQHHVRKSHSVHFIYRKKRGDFTVACRTAWLGK